MLHSCWHLYCYYYYYYWRYFLAPNYNPDVI